MAVSARSPGMVLIVYIEVLCLGVARLLMTPMLVPPCCPVEGAGQNVDDLRGVDNGNNWMPPLVETGGIAGWLAVAPAGCLPAQDDRGEVGDVPPGLAHRVGRGPVLDGPGQ